MQQFKAYLLSKGNIEERKIPFYLYWVKRFRYFISTAGQGKVQKETLDRFLASLQSTVEDWRIKQAQHAAVLYLYYRAGEKSDRNVSIAKPSAVQDGEWESALSEVKTLMRLRQLSHQTERVYEYWIRRFRDFTHSAPLKTLLEEHLKHFLSFLAVEKRISGQLPSGRHSMHCCSFIGI